jgi:hypothetical protein
MDSRLSPPIFTRAPQQYEQAYFNDLVRALISLITYVKAPGEGRQTTIVLTNLASNDSGLETGTIFQVNGALRVSVVNRPYVAGLSSTGRVGSVSITV